MSQEFAESEPPVVRTKTFDEHGSVILVEGDLDLASAPQLEEAISDQIADGHRHLVVDLSEATFLDSTAMQTLLYSLAPLRDNPSAAVVLVGVHGIVERSLTITGIGAMFTTFDTPEAAISNLRNGRSEAMDGAWRTLRPRSEPAPTT